MKADLHIHSSYSNDAEIRIADLLGMCLDQGIDTFSITDHNCVGGSREAEHLSKDLKMNFIPGIEIDCHYEGTDLHLLGYRVDLESNDFDALERSTRRKHLDIVPLMIEKLEHLGISVDLEELMGISGGAPPSGELFADLLLRKPEQADNPKLKPYLPGGERSDMPLINFYLDFFAQGKPAYVKIDHMPFTEAVDLVRDNQGIPVVAHPGLNLRGREERVRELLDQGAAGLEVFNNYHDPGQVKYFADLSIRQGAIMTCGSDFHGKNKPLISIGQYRSTLKYREYLELSLSRLMAREKNR